MLMFGGQALLLRGEPLERPAGYVYDADLYGTLAELDNLRLALSQRIGRKPFLSPQGAPGRFTLRGVELPVIEFDSLTQGVLELAEALPDSSTGNWFGLEIKLASPLTVHLIKLAYVTALPPALVHPKHSEDIGRMGGTASLWGAIQASKPHREFYQGLSALIVQRKTD